MAERFPQQCSVLLTAVSQSLGQVNGKAYGCGKWNLASLRNLNDQLTSLLQPSVDNCAIEAVDSLYKSQNEPGPVIEMIEIVQNLFETYGLTPGGMDQLGEEEVSRMHANVVLGELQTYWLRAVEDITDWYGTGIATDISPNRVR